MRIVFAKVRNMVDPDRPSLSDAADPQAAPARALPLGRSGSSDQVLENGLGRVIYEDLVSRIS